MVQGQIQLTRTAGVVYEDQELREDDTRVPSTTDLKGDALVQKAADYDIPVRTYSRLKDVNKGYYIIIGVFKESKNLPRTIRKLERKGLSAGSFVNPENNLNYVYANRYENGREALFAASTKLGGKHTEAMWILGVENDPNLMKLPEVTTEPAPPKQAAEVALTTQPKAQPLKRHALNPTVKVRSTKSSASAPPMLVRKANSYFDRMWYAEAAELYEQALSRNPEKQSPEMIEKVADAHYFNSNMSRAYYWYNKLYEAGRDKMTAANLFKYAHTLKGTGKYGRARRLLRLYDKKMEEELSGPRDLGLEKEREMVLDNILKSEETFGVKNLEINSRYSDFAPMFYGNDKIVFASSVDSAFFKTRRYKWNDQPYLDLYVARMNEESDELRSAVKFSKEINTKYHEAAVTFSPDQQTMYFTRNNYGKKLRRDQHGINHLKIYRSQKIGGTWTEAEELPFNGEDYSTGHPALSPDGKQLYFVSDMPGSLGETDIFVVDVFEDGSFSNPRNLGPNVNTEHKEMFPFLTENKLYFSSNGHIGLGGLDIYETTFDPEEGYLPAQNAGKPINSKSDDFSFIIREETQKGYFASNRRGGKGDDDLYSFQRLLPEEVNENAIAGVVTDLVGGEALPEAMVELLDENHIKLKEIISSEDGSFVFEELEGDTRYFLRVRKEGYQEEAREFKTSVNERLSTDIALQKLEERITVEDGIRKLKTEMIYFDFDKFTIRKDAASELDELVSMMKEYPAMVIKIESHTDSRGPKAYNKYLSDKRAKSTRDYLIRQGIDPSRIESAIGYGEERLLNECDDTVSCSREKHQRNRRSEFIIVKM